MAEVEQKIRIEVPSELGVSEAQLQQLASKFANELVEKVSGVRAQAQAAQAKEVEVPVLKPETVNIKIKEVPKAVPGPG
jgi:hypothetical protein